MIKNIEIYERAVALAEYLVNNSSTIRKTSEHFSVSKSTLHKDLRVHLKSVSFNLSEQVDEVLKYNQSMKHIRGGEATKRKFKK